MSKQYIESEDYRYYIHRVDPMSILYTIRNVGSTNDLNYAIRRCKELAELDTGKNCVLLYRVVDREREKDWVTFLSLVNFDKVEHWDSRKDDKS